MMLRDEHLPLRARQMPNALPARARRIQRRLRARFAIDVCAGIDRVGQHMVDGGVARLDPADLGALVHLQWECEPFRAEP